MRLWAAMIAVMLAAGCASQLGQSIPLLPGNSPEAQRQAIARVLDEVHQGIEKKKIFAVLGNVSAAYADEAGRNQDRVREELKAFFSSWRTVRVTRTNPRLKVEGNEAMALEAIGVIAEPLKVDGSPLNWFGELRISLQRDAEGKWMITRVSAAQ